MPPVKTEAFSIQVAAGPYTLDTDLSFGFAKSFFNSLKASKPSVVLLVRTHPLRCIVRSKINYTQLGPFVDSSHQCIREGDVDMSPSEMFEHHFLAPLKGYLNAAPGSLALIVPNVRDINSNVASFPQAGFEPSLISNDDVRATLCLVEDDDNVTQLTSPVAHQTPPQPSAVQPERPIVRRDERRCPVSPEKGGADKAWRVRGLGTPRSRDGDDGS